MPLRKFWNVGFRKCHFRQYWKDISINKSEGKCSSLLFFFNPSVEFWARYNINREITRKGKRYSVVLSFTFAVLIMPPIQVDTC